MSPPDADVAAAARRERAAAYQPDNVRLLLVAHAPPASPERYFYFHPVREKDDLFRYVVRGLFGEFPERAEKPRWLDRLRDAGVFLIDLLEVPYDGQALGPHVLHLVERAVRLRPDHVVLIKVDVFDEAFQPMRQAGMPVVDARIPFPGSGQQQRFQVAFGDALRRIGWSGP